MPLIIKAGIGSLTYKFISTGHEVGAERELGGSGRLRALSAPTGHLPSRVLPSGGVLSPCFFLPHLQQALSALASVFLRGHVWEPEDASPSSCWAVHLASSVPWHLCTSVDGGGQLWRGRGARHRLRITSVSTSGGLHSPLGVFGLGSGPKQEILFVWAT